jgi:hypothetical protein
MRSRLHWLVLLFVCVPALCFSAHPKPCRAADDAAKLLNKDVCISAHVYDVVELPDGTRFLDLCPPGTIDDRCAFTIVSLNADRSEVGELSKYRNMNVHVRGIVQSMHGRTGMFLSHARQFEGGPPKFRPNPKLQRGFSGEADKPPVSDPNLRPQGGHHGFTNIRDLEPLPKN